MNSLNLKFEPKKKKDLSRVNFNSIILGVCLALAILTSLYMVSYYEMKEYQGKIDEIQTEYDELYNLISKPGYNISLNESILSIENNRFDLGKVYEELKNIHEIDQLKYYYTKQGSSLMFSVEVVIKTDTLSQGQAYKTSVKALNWQKSVVELDSSHSNSKYSLKYQIVLNMEALKYETI